MNALEHPMMNKALYKSQYSIIIIIIIIIITIIIIKMLRYFLIGARKTRQTVIIVHLLLAWVQIVQYKLYTNTPGS